MDTPRDPSGWSIRSRLSVLRISPQVYFCLPDLGVVLKDLVNTLFVGHLVPPRWCLFIGRYRYVFTCVLLFIWEIMFALLLDGQIHATSVPGHTRA